MSRGHDPTTEWCPRDADGFCAYALAGRECVKGKPCPKDAEDRRRRWRNWNRANKRAGLPAPRLIVVP